MYKLFWIPEKDKKLVPEEKVYIGTYTSIKKCQDVVYSKKTMDKYKGQKGMFFRTINGREYIAVI